MTERSPRVMACASPPRLAFVTSHPIQYQVPIFRLLAKCDVISFQVLFGMVPSAAAQGSGFGVEFQWDVPLLEGYEYKVLENVSRNPSVTQFHGCDTPSIKRILREQKIEAVVVNGWVVKTCLQTLFACKQLGIPCIVRGEANQLRPRAWWKRILQRQLVHRFDAFLPIGVANREFYYGYGIHEDSMFDAKYCVENQRFETAASHAKQLRGALRKQWQIPWDATCFLFCGKFEHKKHPVELLEAFRMACQRSSGKGRSLHLVMVGDGILRSTCEEFVRDSQLPVTFTGFLNQSAIVNAYVATDCLVLPSDYGETWGLVANEAMACSRPAIVSDQVGCARDLVSEGTTGFVFPFGDWQALSHVMLRCSSGEVDLEQMGRHAHARIQEYSPESAADGIVKAVQHTLLRMHSRNGR